MAEVPYTPEPTLEPTLRPSPNVDVPVGEAAFGGNIANALHSVGASAEGAYNQLWSTAMDIHKMRMELNVMDQTSEYEKEANVAHAQFTSLRGDQAAQAYPAYQQQLEDIRQKYRGDIPLAGQVMYDGQTRGMQGRLLFNAAGHAGQELTQKQITSAKSAVDLAKQSAGQFWNDDATFNASLKHIDDMGLQYYRKAVGAQGTDEEIRGTDAYKDYILDQKSDAILERYRLMGITDPLRAQKGLDKDIAGQNVRGDKVPQIQGWLQTRANEIQAPQVARGIRSGDGYDWGAGTVGMPRAREAIGGFETGNQYGTVSSVETSHGHALGRYQVMSGYLPDYLKQAGLPTMSEKDFVASPAAQDTVFEKVFGANMTKYGSFNEAASRWFTGQSIADARTSKATDALGTGIDSYLRNTNSYLARSSSLDDQLVAGDKVSSVAKDPMFREHVRQNLLHEHNEAASVQRASIYDAKEAVAGALQKGNIRTVDDLMLDPNTAATLSNSPATFRNELPAMINRYNTAANKVRNDDNYDRALGLMYSQDPDDRVKFMDLDPTKVDVSQGQVRQLWAAQAKLRKQGEADPKVNQAYQEILRKYPDSTPKRKDDEERFLQFNGTLSRYIEEYQKKYNKEPSFEDYDKMGELLTKPAIPHWFSQPTEEFEKPIPDDFQSHWESLGMRNEEVRDLWNRTQAQMNFNQFWKGATKSESDGRPAVPVSK